MSPAEKVRETVEHWPASSRYIAVVVTMLLVLNVAEWLR